ncbi:AI-2E family transporter [Algoriphagus sp. D3-2-R+10]|uniref:AI-2E family transporter n=1 Tax=Algoriphagus aurantiacus TaxID=3103948 RepID=UPI002B39C69F|nr:AI-2E family transporter [Algoriphagus sp. D3-2-R+10]MEB2777432.1 AI-2E family transporter [Algoriphagus sp. D3-2-R+10]
MESSKIQQVSQSLICVVLGVIILREGAFLLVPLLWGVFFAFALNPIVSWLENKRLPRGIAILLSIALVLILASGIIYLFSKQMAGLLKDVPEISSSLKDRLDQYLGYINNQFGFGMSYKGAVDSLGTLINPDNFNGLLVQTGKALALIGIIPLYIFLLIYYKDFFWEFLNRLNTTKNQAFFFTWAEDTALMIQAYLTGLLKVTVIVAILVGCFFYIIDVQYFVLFALFIAVLNLIPYVGVVFSSFFTVLYVFLTTDSIFFPILTLGVLWGVQLLENNIITPIIVGAEVKLNALVVLLAILVGGWIWGVSGMVLFIPLLGILKMTLEKSDKYKAYAYLLGDKVPVLEKRENLWKILKRKVTGK